MRDPAQCEPDKSPVLKGENSEPHSCACPTLTTARHEAVIRPGSVSGNILMLSYTVLRCCLMVAFWHQTMTPSFPAGPAGITLRLPAPNAAPVRAESSIAAQKPAISEFPPEDTVIVPYSLHITNAFVQAAIFQPCAITFNYKSSPSAASDRANLELISVNGGGPVGWPGVFRADAGLRGRHCLLRY